MSTTEPIKNKEKLDAFREYYKEIQPNPRNHALIVMGLNTAFRIGDILKLKWQDVIQADQTLYDHIRIKEQKTGKMRIVPINQALHQTLQSYQSSLPEAGAHNWLFPSPRTPSQPLSRHQAYRIVRNAAIACGLPEHIGCHSLRKTFGYYAWKQGTPPAMLMDLYNHSSYQITKRYLGIEQDERDQVYLQINL